MVPLFYLIIPVNIPEGRQVVENGSIFFMLSYHDVSKYIIRNKPF